MTRSAQTATPRPISASAEHPTSTSWVNPGRYPDLTLNGHGRTRDVGLISGESGRRIRAAGSDPDGDSGVPACFSVGPDGRIADWTRGAERLVGWPAIRANGRRADDLLITPSSLRSYHNEVAILENGGQIDGWLRLYVNHLDGRQVPVGLSLSQVYSDRNIHLHVAMRPGGATTGPDPLHSILSSVLGDLPGVDGVASCDADGHLIAVTGVLEDLFGPAEGRIGDNRWRAGIAGIHNGSGRPLPPHAFPLTRALRGETFQDSPFVVERTDGSSRPLRAAGRPLCTPDGQSLGAIVTVRAVAR